MDFYFSTYSVPLLVGYAHGYLFAVLMAYRAWQRRSVADLLLAFCLVLLSQQIMLYMLGFGGIEIFWNEWLFVPTSVALLIGPAFWWYLRSVTGQPVEFRTDWIHLLPFALQQLYHWQAVVQGHEYAVWFNDAVHNQMRLYLVWYLVGVGSQFWYLRQALLLYKRYSRWTRSEYADPGIVSYRWIRNVLLALTIALSSSLVMTVIDEVWDLNFWQDWWDHLITIGVVYYIGISALMQPRHKAINYHDAETATAYSEGSVSVETSAKAPTLLEGVLSESAPSKSDALESSKLSYQYQELLTYMQEHKPWLDPELSLSSLAQQMHLSAKTLSQLINKMGGVNFNDFVNRYRVEHVQLLKQDPAYQHLTLVGLAMEAGFNSKATFNRSYRAITGKTPSV